MAALAKVKAIVALNIRLIHGNEKLIGSRIIRQLTREWTIEDPYGNPLKNAEVKFYDGTLGRRRNQVLTTKTTNGEFEFSDVDSPPEQPHLVVVDPDTGFFTSRRISLQQSVYITASQQFFTKGESGYGPLIMNTEPARGVVSVWQEYHHSKRIFKIEVSGMKPEESGWQTGLGLVLASFAVPETATVLYEDNRMKYFPVSSDLGTKNDRLMKNWHPTETGLPLFDGSPLTDNAIFKNVTQEAIEKERDREQIGEEILDSIRYLNILLTAGDVARIFKRNQSETSTKRVGGDEIGSLDPNEFDVVGRVSPLSSFATVFEMHVQLPSEDTASWPLFTRAEWRSQSSARSDTHDRWRFEQEYSVSSRGDSSDKPAPSESTNTVFNDGFEDGSMSEWQEVVLEDPDNENRSEWELTGNAISGNYSAYSETNGDKNVLRTAEEIVDSSQNFRISFKWKTDTADSRGVQFGLSDGTKTNNGENLKQVLGGQIRWPINGPPILQLLQETKAHSEPLTGTVHAVDFGAEGDNVSLEFGGKSVSTSRPEMSGVKYIVFDSSGHYGAPSTIMIDDVVVQQ